MRVASHLSILTLECGIEQEAPTVQTERRELLTVKQSYFLAMSGIIRP